MLLEKHRLCLILILLTCLSCSNLPSGQYVLVTKKTNLKTLSKIYKTSSWKLGEYNKNKKIFNKGDWVFIPKNWGIANKSMNSVQLHRYFATGDFLWPVPSSKKVTSGFGHRWGKKHEGVDIAARVGSFIVAAKSGKVVYSSWMGGYGKVVVLGHADGVFSVYAHAKTSYVTKGQIVSKGEVIAKVGMTGRTSGPHLHFELRYNSKAINPMKFFAKR